MSLKTAETWLQQYWNIVLNYSEGPGGKMNLGPFNNKLWLEALKSPKTNFLQRAIMLMYKDSLYDDHTLALCCTAALNAWDRIEEVGKRTESFAKVIQYPKETFTDFLQRLTSAVNRMIPNSESRQIIIESLAFENAISQCKRVIRHLKARLALIQKWI